MKDHQMSLKWKTLMSNNNYSNVVVEKKTINLLINKCSKLAQRKHNPKHDWVEKMIHWELCKKLKFDYNSKWYMRKPESVPDNETHLVFWDFEIQTITYSRPDQMIIKQKKSDKYLDLRKLRHLKVMVRIIAIGTLEMVLKDFVRGGWKNWKSEDEKR